MAHRIVIAGLTLAAIGLAGASRAESPWYVSGSMGGYFREDSANPANFTRTATVLTLQTPSQPTATVPPPPAPPGDIVVTGRPRPILVPELVTYHAVGVEKLNYQPGGSASLAIGYRLNAGFRVEVEAGYTEYAAGTLRPVTADPNFPALDGRAFRLNAGGRYSRETATLNGFYDFRLSGSRWTPYLGVGAGAAETRRLTGYFISADGRTFRNASGSGVGGLGLAEAGVNIRLTPNLTLAPSYRYIRYFSDAADIAHVVKASLRYVF